MGGRRLTLDAVSARELTQFALEGVLVLCAGGPTAWEAAKLPTCTT